MSLFTRIFTGKTLACLLLAPLLLTVLGGCSVYVDGYYYSPHPAVVDISTAPVPPPTTQPQSNPPASSIVVTSSVSVIGVRRDDSKHGLPASVQLRFRFENHGTRQVAFNPQSLEMIDGGLLKFLPPIVRPPQTITLAPAQLTLVDAWFPFPEGTWWDTADMRSLDVRWTMEIDGQAVPQRVQFQRIRPRDYYDGPYWDAASYYYPYSPFGPFGGIGFGFVVGHRR